MSYDLYVLTDGNITTKVTGVVSEAMEDVTIYDSSTYRDAHDIQLASDLSTTVNSLTTPTDPTTVTVGDIKYQKFPNEKLVEASLITEEGVETVIHSVDNDTGPPIVTTTIDTTTDTRVPDVQVDAAKSYTITDYKNLDDVKAHVAPRFHAKKRTRVKFTTAAGMYWFWVDQIIGISTDPFTFVS